jgi:hypothetical protein
MATHPSRRNFLKTAFCSSAALALNLRTGCAAPAFPKTDAHVLLLGDFGSGTLPQSQVARAMTSYVSQTGISPRWLVLLGDNFYGNKLLGGGLNEERWRSGFEELYPASVFDCPCPAILGNHDYHDTAQGDLKQLAYAKAGGTRWTMPSKWFRMDLGEFATFLFIDTNLRSVSGLGGSLAPFKILHCLTQEEESLQWEWLKAQLASARKAFTFVVGHHPVYSNGQHGDQAELVEKLGPMLEEAGVHWYLCGHDHDLQHLELGALRTSFAISGGGGASTRGLKNSSRAVPFGRAVYGFSHLQVNGSQTILRHLDITGTQIHAVEKTLNFQWRILNDASA